MEKKVFENIIGASKEIKETIEIARKVALSDVPVLLLGETGVGKKLFANSIHNESIRRESPFVSINCSNLLESEMFGYKTDTRIGSSNLKECWRRQTQGQFFSMR